MGIGLQLPSCEDRLLDIVHANLFLGSFLENEQSVIGVRFTQGDQAALPAAARELIQYGVDIIQRENQI